MVNRNLVYSLFEQGKYNEVIAFFSTNLPQTPDDYNLEALSFYKLGLVKEAVNVLKHGLTFSLIIRIFCSISSKFCILSKIMKRQKDTWKRQ